MKRGSKYDYLQFGSEPKKASKYGLDTKLNKARKEEKRTYT